MHQPFPAMPLSPLYEKFAEKCNEIQAYSETKSCGAINMAVRKLVL